MENLKRILENPFDGIDDTQVFQKKCAKIAKELLDNYCIKCGNKEFYFAEIEFYYFETNKWENDWNKVTYTRDKMTEGSLFYHLSGIDVSFAGEVKKIKGKKEGKGGGILIRSIGEINDKGDVFSVTVGSLTCANKILNACKGEQMPRLEKKEKISTSSLEPKETYRYLGKKDFDFIGERTNTDGELKLAFYDDTISKDLWNKARSSYYDNRLTRFDSK